MANAKVCWNGTTQIAKRGESDMANFRPHYRKCMKCEDRENCQGMCADVCVEEVFKMEERKERLKQFEVDLYTSKRIQKYRKRKRGR